MKLRISSLVLVALCLPCIALADVKPAGLFCDHMVIQRDTQAPVWGTADAGEQVTVTGSWGQSAETTADEAGKWRVKIKTPAAGGPHTITLKGKDTVEVKDVMSGDVWLCSGQSNMAWSVAKSTNPKEDIANAKYPQIRSFMVPRNAASERAEDCAGEWKVCSPQTVKTFSAAAYFTGRELHKNLKVPIGLLTSCWGGTKIEAWTPAAERADVASTKTVVLAAEEKGAKKKKGKKKGKVKPGTNKLYNGMIHPLRTFPVKGAIWYQGESNAKDMASSVRYREQLPSMILSWRKAWGQDFPFYTVQLPNWRSPQTTPVELDSTWAMIRESFVHAANNTPDVFTCTTIDIGEEKNIHPKNKQDVGRRMASTILNKTYGKGTPTTPFMKSFKVEGGKVVVTFDYTGSGLMAKGGKLKTFAIAGADQKFVAADAEIVNRDGADCVVVSAAEVKEPVAARYAWAGNPAECNLYSKEMFPASPFRTDDWKPPVSEPSPKKKSRKKKK